MSSQAEKGTRWIAIHLVPFSVSTFIRLFQCFKVDLLHIEESLRDFTYLFW